MSDRIQYGSESGLFVVILACCRDVALLRLYRDLVGEQISYPNRIEIGSAIAPIIRSKFLLR